MAELVTPIIAAASGILGAGVGGTVTLLVTRNQLKAAARAQESEWAREDRLRRVSQYADLVAVASEVMVSWSHLLAPRPVDEIQTLDDAQERLYAELQRLIAMTRITAPAPSLDRAEEMMVAIRRAQTFVRAYAGHGKTGVAGDVENTAWLEIERSFLDARGAFAEAVRVTHLDLPPWDSTRSKA